MKYFKHLRTLCAVGLLITLAACQTEEEAVIDAQETTEEAVDQDSVTNNQTMLEAPENLPIATIEFDGFGTITAELCPHLAPNTVNNFISLANDGYFDGIIVHRIEQDFVLQMGDPTGTGSGGPGYSIEGEFTSNGFTNELLHTQGVLSMARTSDPNSAGSQFFIMLEDAPHLDGAYASFGKVIEGMDVAEAIEAVERVAGTSKPVTDVVIKQLRVETFDETYEEPIPFE